jgi:hypothetical protein
MSPVRRKNYWMSTSIDQDLNILHNPSTEYLPFRDRAYDLHEEVTCFEWDTEDTVKRKMRVFPHAIRISVVHPPHWKLWDLFLWKLWDHPNPSKKHDWLVHWSHRWCNQGLHRLVSPLVDGGDLKTTFLTHVMDLRILMVSKWPRPGLNSGLVQRNFFGFFFRFSKAKGTLLVFLFLRTRDQKLMKEYGVERWSDVFWVRYRVYSERWDLFSFFLSSTSRFERVLSFSWGFVPSTCFPLILIVHMNFLLVTKD